EFLFLSFVFFFSSRRRHTRWPRDWSSDVCSSDLLSTDCFATHDVCNSPTRYGCRPELFEQVVKQSVDSGARLIPVSQALAEIGRSEERRVGKEGRLGWWKEQLKKKKRRESEDGWE